MFKYKLNSVKMNVMDMVNVMDMAHIIVSSFESGMMLWRQGRTKAVLGPRLELV